MTWISILLFWVNSVCTAFSHATCEQPFPEIHQTLSVGVVDSIQAQDTLVNYCKLIQAAFFYGKRFGDKKQGLSTGDVEFFNRMWQDVFSDTTYRIQITQYEFVMGAKFGEGNHPSFPPSSLYHKSYPDTYYLFHMVKEIGMVHSTYFSKCPSCVDYSLAKINAYLTVMPIRSQIPQIWQEDINKKLSSQSELDQFMELLKCIYPDHQINPKTEYRAETGYDARCGDTTRIASIEDVHPNAVFCGLCCDDVVTIDTLSPLLMSGSPQDHNAVYMVALIAQSNCASLDTCRQYFILE